MLEKPYRENLYHHLNRMEQQLWLLMLLLFVSNSSNQCPEIWSSQCMFCHKEQCRELEWPSSVDPAAHCLASYKCNCTMMIQCKNLLFVSTQSGTFGPGTTRCNVEPVILTDDKSTKKLSLTLMLKGT